MRCYPLTVLPGLAYSRTCHTKLKRPAWRWGVPEMFQAGLVGSSSTPSLTAQGVGEGVHVFVGLVFGGVAALCEGRRGVQRQDGCTAPFHGPDRPSGIPQNPLRRCLWG